MRRLARVVNLPPELRKLAVLLVMATQPDCPQAPESVKRLVRYGSSPRGAQAIVLAAKIRTAAAARDQVTRADLLAAVYPALRHRLLLNFEGQAENVPSDQILADVLKVVAKGSK